MATSTKKVVTPKEIAEELGLTPLQVRIWLRSQELNVGRGKRYKFTEAEAKKITAKVAEHYEVEV